MRQYRRVRPFAIEISYRRLQELHRFFGCHAYRVRLLKSSWGHALRKLCLRDDGITVGTGNVAPQLFSRLSRSRRRNGTGFKGPRIRRSFDSYTSWLNGQAYSPSCNAVDLIRRPASCRLAVLAKAPPIVGFIAVSGRDKMSAAVRVGRRRRIDVPSRAVSQGAALCFCILT